VIDFNPWSPMTDPLLFTWAELLVIAQRPSGTLPELRLVDGAGIQPSDLQSYRLPQDIVDLASGTDIHKFADLFMKVNYDILCINYVYHNILFVQGKLTGQDSDSD